VGLTKTGSGTLVLSGSNNAYTGTTYIYGGAQSINGSGVFSFGAGGQADKSQVQRYQERLEEQHGMEGQYYQQQGNQTLGLGSAGNPNYTANRGMQQQGQPVQSGQQPNRTMAGGLLNPDSPQAQQQDFVGATSSNERNVVVLGEGGMAGKLVLGNGVVARNQTLDGLVESGIEGRNMPSRRTSADQQRAPAEQPQHEKDLASLASEITFTVTPPAWADGGRAVTGLASLDVDLPTRDGMYEVYRFTTPRGEVEITAWSASESLVNKLIYLAVVAVAVIAVWCVARVAHRVRLSGSSGRHVSTALIALGLLALLCGFFWAAALAAILVGFVMKIRLAIMKERPAASNC
jgi:autotransporter-associated beta strand protein